MGTGLGTGRGFGKGGFVQRGSQMISLASEVNREE